MPEVRLRQRVFDEEEEAPLRPFNRAHFFRLLGYLFPYRKQIVLTLLLMLIAAAATQANPYLFRVIIDQFIKNKNLRGVNLAALGLVGLNLVTWATAYGRTLIMSRVGQRILFRMRQQLFNHIQRLSFRFYDSRPAGKIMVRITGDVGTLNELLTNGVINVIFEAFNLVAIVTIMLYMHATLALISFATLPALLFLGVYMRPRMHLNWYRVRQRISTINANLNESISGMKVTQAFTREEENLERFRDLNRETLQSWMQAIRANAIFMPTVEFVAAAGTALLFWYGTRSLENGTLTLGMLVAFLNYLGRFWEPVNIMTTFYTQILTAMASAERVFEILDTAPEIKDAPDAVPLPPVVGEVIFEHVTFGYDPGQVVLQDFNLRVAPGETVALVGPTGAGKSSVINLLMRFYDPQKGRILVDGVDLRHITQNSLREQIGIVLQDTFIFSGKIKDNIRYGKLDATMEELIRAAKIANAHAFITSLPAGYETEVEERGSLLSVGQRQLIAFARALLADPRILILDEATANIDSETELLIQQALERLLEGRTAFVIAHRLSTIRNADRIVVIDHGRIVESGRHEELLVRPGGAYRALCEAQLQQAM